MSDDNEKPVKPFHFTPAEAKRIRDELAGRVHEPYVHATPTEEETLAIADDLTHPITGFTRDHRSGFTARQTPPAETHVEEQGNRPDSERAK